NTQDLVEFEGGDPQTAVQVAGHRVPVLVILGGEVLLQKIGDARPVRGVGPEILHEPGVGGGVGGAGDQQDEKRPNTEPGTQPGHEISPTVTGVASRRKVPYENA